MVVIPNDFVAAAGVVVVVVIVVVVVVYLTGDVLFDCISVGSVRLVDGDTVLYVGVAVDRSDGVVGKTVVTAAFFDVTRVVVRIDCKEVCFVVEAVELVVVEIVVVVGVGGDGVAVVFVVVFAKGATSTCMSPRLFR